MREGKVPVTEFRAGVIAGSGSISFEMIRFMTELLPIVPGPLWMKNRTQPIAIQNVIDYLCAALTNPKGRGGVFEIGGPDIEKYADLMLRYARLRGLRRRMVLLPGIPLWFMAFGVGLITPVPYPIAYALIGGLSADSLVRHLQALAVFPEVRLIDFDSATKDALKKTHPHYVERVWHDGDLKTKFLKHEGFFILHKSISRVGVLQDVLEAKRGEGMGFREEHHSLFGDIWLERRIGRTDKLSYATIFFSPRGFLGFLYWFLLYPFHWWKLRGLIRKVKIQKILQ